LRSGDFKPLLAYAEADAAARRTAQQISHLAPLQRALWLASGCTRSVAGSFSSRINSTHRNIGRRYKLTILKFQLGLIQTLQWLQGRCASACAASTRPARPPPQAAPAIAKLAASYRLWTWAVLPYLR
jgi:hypothetical protein